MIVCENEKFSYGHFYYGTESEGNMFTQLCLKILIS